MMSVVGTTRTFRNVRYLSGAKRTSSARYEHFRLTQSGLRAAMMVASKSLKQWLSRIVCRHVVRIEAIQPVTAISIIDEINK